MEPAISVVEGVSLCLGVLGTVLGVINTLHALGRDKVRLRVVPKAAYPIGMPGSREPRLCIEVTNMSWFPVTINEIGVLYHGSDARGSLAPPILMDGGSFPRRLESRSSFTAYAAPGALQDRGAPPIRCAFAKTDCGTIVEGDSPAFQKLVLDATLAR
jgi:hypothetical protein